MEDYPEFQVGDVIRIDDYEALKARSQGSDGTMFGLIGFDAGFVGGMCRFCGKELMVDGILRFQREGKYYRWYQLEGDDNRYNWSPDMFDLSYTNTPELDFEITEDDITKLF